MADSSWSVKKLESANPKHPLVLMTKNNRTSLKGEKASDKKDDGGTKSEVAGVDAGQAKTILTQLERGARSDEARSIVESIRTSLGLN